MNARLFALAVVGAFLSHAPLANTQEPQKPTPEPKDAQPARLAPWLDDLSAAYREAALKQRPIFVRVGGVGCGWCAKLELEIAKPEVQAELKRWTLVYLDLDRAPVDVRKLAVGPIPALRALTGTGRVVQASDGYREAADLVKWLQQQYTAATSAPDTALLSSGPPNVAETLRLVRAFGDRDSLIREAAIRRLLPHAAVAREDVVTALKEGSLAARLCALELLSEWRAPVQGLDPWRPETLAAEKLAPLDDWLKADLPASATAAAQQLHEKELRALKTDLQQLVTADEASVPALRERIARIGDVALPHVNEALAVAATDREHERLLALRYRLVSTSDLPLRWPGGLERLASRDVKQRHQAADELAQLGLPELQPLLLELFSDPDPLVRELSLRGLRQLGGKRATAALVKLLDDPDANVRASVLKQLAEDAQTDMLTKIGEYVQREKDADLLVHAVRYLREVKQPEAVGYMLPLLDHESWQVRAEAAEGIGKIIEGDRYGSSRPATPPAVLEKLRALLADPDAFVVSRAAEALPRQLNEKSIDALLKAAEAHPGLAVEIVAQVSSNAADRSVAIPKLLPFLTHDKYEVRAAAIRVLCDLQDKETAPRLVRALQDPAPQVRIAAADALDDALQTLRPSVDELVLRALSPPRLVSPPSPPAPVPEPAPKVEPAAEQPAGDKPASEDEESSLDSWLRDLQAGKHRPKWTSELLPPLQKMLASADPHEQAVAARALVPLGEAAAAWPVLLKSAPQHAAAYSAAIETQKWLLGTKRLELFRALGKLAKDDDQLASLLHSASSPPERRLAPEIWQLLDRPDLAANVSSAALWALKSTYLGSRYYDPDSITEKQKTAAAAAIEPEVATGQTRKRLVALNLLLTIAPEKASAAVNLILKDEQAPAELRRDAFQILLLTLPPAEREKQAIAVLTEGDKDRSLTALRLLTLGVHSLTELPATKYDLELESEFFSNRNETELRATGGLQPIIPQPPRQLTADQIRPRTTDGDEEVAAYAGYLLALLGEADGLRPLLAHWRASKPTAQLDRLVYRAISVLDDPAQLGHLRTIYARLADEDAKGEFYWTIRIMSGAEILEFRDQIRKEVGVEKLRNSQNRFSF